MRFALAAALWIMGLVGAMLLTSQPQMEQARKLDRAADLFGEVRRSELLLDRAVLSARHAAGDPDATISKSVTGLQGTLVQAQGALDEIMPDAPPAVAQLVDVVDARSKSATALVPELDALRQASTSLGSLLTAVPNDVAAPAAVSADLRALATEMTADLGNRPDAAERLTAIAARLRAASQTGTPEGRTLAELAERTEAVITARQVVDQRLDAFFTASTGAAHDALHGKIEDMSGTVLNNARSRRTLRMVLVALLVLLGVRGLWGVRRRTQNLEEGLEARTLALEAANAELEAEVEARRRTESELADALKKARAATQAKADFLANMSHEIRTPMNGVVGMTELLLDTKLDAEQLNYVRSVERSATALLTVINDILDFSKIEAGRMDIEARPFDAHQLVDDVLGVLSPAAHGKKLRLERRFDDNVSRWMSGDQVRLRQVLLNLAGNAVKFTEQGKVTVEVKQRSDLVEFAVVDTGIGIPADRLRLIFNAFSQADTSTSRKFGGTGLGLAICRQLAKLMGGEITVDSQVGRGSRFAISLPLEPAEEPVQSPAEPTKGSRPPKPITDQVRVLLAEDNVINQRVATRLLEKLGCQVYGVDDGAAAVEHALNRDFDLVFMDCQMPRLDGYAATRTLRAQGFETPIVAMTANAMPGDRERCLDAGMDDYIAKPISRAELDRVLQAWAPTSTSAPPNTDATAV